MARRNPSIEYTGEPEWASGPGDYRPFANTDFGFDLTSFDQFDSMTGEIDEVMLGIGDTITGLGFNYLDFVAGVGDFALGWFESQAAKDDAMAQIERDIASLLDERQDAITRGEGLGRQAEEEYERLVRHAEENLGIARKDIEQLFAEAMDQNVDLQGEARHKANLDAVSRNLRGAVAAGDTTAKLAQSGVRKSGSASNLMGESNRMLNVDLAELDRQLSSEMARYGRQRDTFRSGKNRNMRKVQTSFDQRIENVQGGFESAMENLEGGRDIDFSSFFSGEQSFVDAMGGEGWASSTILTAPVSDALTGLRSSRTQIQDQWDDSPYSVVEDVFSVIGNAAVDLFDWLF